MAEEFDLNKLRRQSQLQREKPAKKTRERQIAELEARVVELEKLAGGPTAREKFLAKSSEDQQVELSEYNARQELASEQFDTLQEYIEETYQDGPSLVGLRLQAAKLQLEKLRAEH